VDQAVTLPTSENDAPPKGRNRSFAVFGLVLALLTAGGGAYWLRVRDLITTDDAFIDGHIAQISAQTAGRVTHLYVRDNETVSAGQILLEIDPSDALIKRKQALAALASARAQAAQEEANLVLREAQANQAGATADATAADLAQAKQDLARYQRINPNAITRQSLDTATTTARGAEARLAAARNNAQASHAAVLVEQAAIEVAQAQIQTAQSALDDADLNLARTKLVAPFAGKVAKRSVEQGNYVTTGQPLVTIVQPELWVTANYKETQLTDMHPGQAVDISIDGFPGVVFHGHVDSFSDGTGSMFSSLPVENATGNYVKVVQRLAVKITFDDQPWKNYALSPGMSVTPSVHAR